MLFCHTHGVPQVVAVFSSAGYLKFLTLKLENVTDFIYNITFSVKNIIKGLNYVLYEFSEILFIEIIKYQHKD